jgi:nitrous oxidase accessory protein
MGLLFWTLLGAWAVGQSLQEAIDHAPAGARLELPAGIYRGNIVIDKPLIIDGRNQKAIIEGEGNGTVVRIRSPFVTLTRLTIRNSGAQHERLDSGIDARQSDHIALTHNRIENCLFGINLEQVSESNISDNWINSKPFSLGMRGDGVRLWYSNDNILDHNYLTHSRDFVVWYSHGNYITNNYGEYGRYSLHFMYAGRNYVHHNTYVHNSVGIFFMYSRDTIATDNVVRNSLGTTGLGIGLKDASNFVIKRNKILYNARGLYIDRSPFQPDTNNTIVGNAILYNSEGVHFHSLSIANVFRDNILKGNIETVVNDSYNTKVEQNIWDGNYWERYEGFDRDGDGVGDTPYHLYSYADKVWMLNPNVKFFYGSPVISVLNFLARLAPLSEPTRLVTDLHPKTMEGKIQ